MVKRDCFAFISTYECNALKEIDCNKCAFYKPKKEVKNNVFYPWSYSSLQKYLKDKEKLEEVKRCTKLLKME